MRRAIPVFPLEKRKIMERWWHKSKTLTSTSGSPGTESCALAPQASIPLIFLEMLSYMHQQPWETSRTNAYNDLVFLPSTTSASTSPLIPLQDIFLQRWQPDAGHCSPPFCCFVSFFSPIVLNSISELIPSEKANLSQETRPWYPKVATSNLVSSPQVTLAGII